MTDSRSGRIWVIAGLCLAAAAATGWLVTFVSVSFAAAPGTVEDLTAKWKSADPTPLGASTTVEVAHGDTLVAFLVGTDLSGIAGTTTGTCSASAPGHAVELGWPVHIDHSLTGLLEADQETVPIAGWTNDLPGDQPVSVRVTCTSSDSTVDHFVAVPTKSAALEADPWFQPWGWVGLGALGIVLTGVGIARLPRAPDEGDVTSFS